MSIKSKWVDNRCCDWDALLVGFIEAATDEEVGVNTCDVLLLNSLNFSVKK
jgi:hypothetical protein